MYYIYKEAKRKKNSFMEKINYRTVSLKNSVGKDEQKAPLPFNS